MLLRHCLFAAAIATTAVAPLTATATAAAADQPQIQQVPLDKSKVSRFLASYPELKALGKKYEKDNPKAVDAGKGPMAALSGYMQHQAARAEMESVLSSHGFASFPKWLDVARSVALAYGFVKSGKTPQQLGGQAEKALASIRDNSRLSDAQKKQMEELVTQQLGRLKQYEPLPGNLAIAREMQSEIAAVMDSD